MIKIGIDGGDFLPGSTVNSGIKRVVNSFIHECKKLKKQFLIDYYYFGNSFLFSSFFLPINVIRSNDDVFLGFSGNIPALLKWTKVKKILFIYDFGFYKYPHLYKNSPRLIANTNSSVRIADKIIVFSDYVKQELVKRFPYLNKNQVVRIYAGINHLRDSITNNKSLITHNNYFLYVGVIKPTKNIELLIRCFNDFIDKTHDKKHQLILIGKKGDYHPGKIKYSNRVVFLENLTDEELVSYYQNAKAVLNFSYDEGFCFPVLEGLSFGKPVIVNNLPLYSEFLKYFPNLIITETYSQVVDSMINCLKQKNINLTIKINPLFAWRHFTAQLLKVIQQ
jgi:glycosyltransferase involved in cell wall biosynthesis